jgi:DNA-binding IclR family transcriptional regulator
LANGLESVERVMRMLDMFETEGPELRLTDLSDRLGISKPQALRMASTLEQGGYLARDPETKRYRLGLRLFMLGLEVERQMDLRRVARPVLRDLASETGETVGLFIPDRSGPVCVDVIISQHGLRVFAQQGRRMPWNAGASAKVILAFLSEDDQEQILTAAPFKRYTDATITDPQELKMVLYSIRANGFYIGTQDLDPGIIGIASPVLDHRGTVAGAIAVSAPASRMTESDIPGLVGLIVDACRKTSCQMGYVGPPVGSVESLTPLPSHSSPDRVQRRIEVDAVRAR